MSATLVLGRSSFVGNAATHVLADSPKARSSKIDRNALRAIARGE